MITKLIIILWMVGMALAATACSSPDSMLDDTKWFLRSYGEQNNLEAIIADTEITATFDSAEGEVSGSGGCNTYSARYELEGSKLSISEMTSTEMGCVSPEGVMEQEQEVLSLLANVQSFQADDTTLTIIGSDGRQLYFTTATG
jgi:heat shock protein HslJ